MSNEQTYPLNHRTEILKAVLEQLKKDGYKTVAAIAESFDINPSYISQLLNGKRGFGEAAARNLEVKMGLPEFSFEKDRMLLGGDIAFSKTSIELNRMKSLLLGEQCQLSDRTVATRVVGGWVYVIDQEDENNSKSACFVPFTSQYELNAMVDNLIESLESKLVLSKNFKEGAK